MKKKLKLDDLGDFLTITGVDEKLAVNDQRKVLIIKDKDGKRYDYSDLIKPGGELPFIEFKEESANGFMYHFVTIDKPI